MSNPLQPITPTQLADRLRQGRALVVDIREPDEFAREHIEGAVSAPLSVFESSHIAIAPERVVVFTCRTGNRTGVHCRRLADRVSGPAFVLEGGLDGWKAAGLPTRANANAPLEIMRQVQIGAGGLVLLGVVLGALVHPALYGLAALVGLGLSVAGVTGFCGMARLLALAPWNRAARA